MISIVIPARNEEQLLPDCLRSLRNQDYRGDYEIIIADNGSTDSTADIARSFGARVISCGEKKSVFHARQVGADAARGDIIAQADADTIYPPDWLSRIARQFASHPEAVAVAGRFVYRAPPSWARVEYFVRHHLNRLSLFLFGRPLLMSGATFAFRRKAFASQNGYRDIVFAPDQYGLTGRLAKAGKILYDGDLCVLTSSRSVEKPFAMILFNVVVHLSRWAGHFATNYIVAVQKFSARSRSRRIAVGLAPLALLIILFIAYGYFVPASEVFGKVYYKASSTQSVVALTFDDGPNEPYTSDVLDTLDRYHIKATFFVVGKNVELYPHTAERIVAEGNVLGNHSYSHNANHALSYYGANDLMLAQLAIFSILGITPTFTVRLTAKETPWELQQVKKMGMIEVTWSVATGELHLKSPLPLAQKIVAGTSPGAIILLHDGYGTDHNSPQADKALTVKALPLIIEGLQARGFRFVTVPELLNVPAYNN